MMPRYKLPKFILNEGTMQNVHNWNYSITTKLEETDDWFEDKNGLIEQLELQMGKLHRSTESLVDFRRTLAANTLALR